MEEDLKEQAPSVRSRILARALLREGLFLAAYREAVATGQADKEVLGVMQQALAGMGLEDTTLWIEMRDLADRLGG